jgi:phage-related protein
MIKYNNVDLTDIAPVKIDDIEVSPINLSPVARQRAIAWGADFVRMGGGTRTVTITFALLDMDRANRESVLQDIRDWAKTDKEYTLELPHFENRHLECVCTGHPDTSYRKWWENKLRLEFSCFSNPYWTSNELVEVPCGQVFSIGGSATPLVEIARSGVTQLTNQTYASRTESMTFTAVPAGTMRIDLNRQTAQIGKTSFMRNYVPSSTWIVPKVGANQMITGAGVVRFRERWV